MRSATPKAAFVPCVMLCAQSKVTLRIAPASAPSAPSQRSAAAPLHPTGPRKTRDKKANKSLGRIFKGGRGADLSEEDKDLVLQGRHNAKQLVLTHLQKNNKCTGKKRQVLAQNIQNLLHCKDPSDGNKVLRTLLDPCRRELNKPILHKSKHQKGVARPTVAEDRGRRNASQQVNPPSSKLNNSIAPPMNSTFP